MDREQQENSGAVRKALKLGRMQRFRQTGHFGQNTPDLWQLYRDVDGGRQHRLLGVLETLIAELGWRGSDDKLVFVKREFLNQSNKCGPRGDAEFLSSSRR